MSVARGCGEQEVGVASGSGWNLWVWLLCVVVRRYIDFPILLIPTPLVYALFCSIPTFCSFFLMFFVLYIIASVDSISRDEPDSPLTQYLTNAGIFRARYTITLFKHHHRVLWLISNRIIV